MRHRPRTGGAHEAPLVRHSARPDWAKLRPRRPSLRRAKVALHSLSGWRLPDEVRLL